MAGFRVGPYRLVRELGRGGMGTVYLAVRSDDQFQKRAIKILRRGTDSEAIVRRFKHERQILEGTDLETLSAARAALAGIDRAGSTIPE